MTNGRSRHLGPDARPVAVPDNVDDPGLVKAAGRVQLPVWVEWSGEEPLTYDLDDPVERDRVYEIVLREGIDDDVRRFIEVDVLADRWDVLEPVLKVSAARGPNCHVSGGRRR